MQAPCDAEVEHVLETSEPDRCKRVLRSVQLWPRWTNYKQLAVDPAKRELPNCSLLVPHPPRCLFKTGHPHWIIPEEICTVVCNVLRRPRPWHSESPHKGGKILPAWSINLATQRSVFWPPVSTMAPENAGLSTRAASESCGATTFPSCEGFTLMPKHCCHLLSSAVWFVQFGVPEILSLLRLLPSAVPPAALLQALPLNGGYGLRYLSNRD